MVDTRLTGEEMGSPASNKEKGQESLSGKTRAIVIGIVLAIIGSLISSSFAKETLTNYTGFIMLLAGIVTFVIGIFATATASLKIHLRQETSASINVKKPKMLFLSIWSIGIGTVIAIIGSILGNAFAKNTVINSSIAYDLLLTGICVFLIGVSGTTIITLKQRKNRPRIKVAKPTAAVTFSDILPIGIAVALVIIGFILAGSYAKESIMNYTGFGTLLSGIALLSIGIAKTVVAILRNRLYPNGKLADGNKPRLILGSIWAISIGLMLIINGTLIASSYAKNTLMNYSGFGMLLAGTSVFVYGLFETTRISAMGYLSSKRTSARDMESLKQKEKLSVRLKNFWNNLVKTSAIINLAGIMVALGLLFFSLWQLDLIVSGPVWWEFSPDGQGWSWPGPGAYANDYFQCFLWKTTIGQAYDTLFLMIFISFIVLFASAFFWPRWRVKNN